MTIVLSELDSFQLKPSFATQVKKRRRRGKRRRKKIWSQNRRRRKRKRRNRNSMVYPTYKQMSKMYPCGCSYVLVFKAGAHKISPKRCFKMCLLALSRYNLLTSFTCFPMCTLSFFFDICSLNSSECSCERMYDLLDWLCSM